MWTRRKIEYIEKVRKTFNGQVFTRAKPGIRPPFSKDFIYVNVDEKIVLDIIGTGVFYIPVENKV